MSAFRSEGEKLIWVVAFVEGTRNHKWGIKDCLIHAHGAVAFARSGLSVGGLQGEPLAMLREVLGEGAPCAFFSSIEDIAGELAGPRDGGEYAKGFESGVLSLFGAIRDHCCPTCHGADKPDTDDD